MKHTQTEITGRNLMKFNLTGTFLTLLAVSLIMSCSCLEIEDEAEFKPSDYSDFVITAFQTFWEVTKGKVTSAEDPKLWIDFADANEKLSKYGIDLEIQFINRMLKRDGLWLSYEADRILYESNNPDKTFKDQIVFFITKTFIKTN